MAYIPPEFLMRTQYASPDYISDLREQFYMPDYKDPRDYLHLSRYRNTRLILDRPTQQVSHETFAQSHIPESNQDRFVTINSTTKDRIDIIAYAAYGFAEYWWVLAIANDFLDPFSLPIGTVVRIPPMSSLYLDGAVLDIAN